MELKIIHINEDKTSEVYSSADCQKLIGLMNEYYPKIGFIKPWVVYFVFKDNQVVGTGSFTGHPKTKKLKLHIGHLKNLKDKALLLLNVKNL
ncbi:MAG: hypothetical protein SH808_03070 [Saprospiraceae bacterium]|nr:hypothetical protein [Saprospiraceae bacterium]